MHAKDGDFGESLLGYRDEVRMTNPTGHAPSASRLTLSFSVTRCQRSFIFRAFQVIRAESGTHSLAHPLEWLCTDYVAGGAYAHPPFAEGNRGPLRLPLFEDQLPVVRAALDLARTAGAPDDSDALAAIAFYFLVFLKQNGFDGGPGSGAGSGPAAAKLSTKVNDHAA